jgi:hypothetical protein
VTPPGAYPVIVAPRRPTRWATTCGRRTRPPTTWSLRSR